MSYQYVVAFVLTGLALQLAERLWPVRSFARRKEIVADMVGLLVAAVSQLAIAYYVSPWVFRLRGFEVVQSVHAHLVALPPIAAGLLFFAAVDFIAYWAHRLNHTRWLWPTHAFHHSAQNLYWVAAQRGSPVQYLLMGLPALSVQVFFVPGGWALWLALVYAVAHDSLIHSNLRLPRLLSLVFVTGESHFVHHARDPRLGNSNFGFLFNVWDRLFGTYVDPRSLPREYELGLPYEIGYARLVLGLPAGAAQQGPSQTPARQP